MEVSDWQVLTHLQSQTESYTKMEVMTETQKVAIQKAKQVQNSIVFFTEHTLHPRKHRRPRRMCECITSMPYMTFVHYVMW